MKVAKMFVARMFVASKGKEDDYGNEIRGSGWSLQRNNLINIWVIARSFKFHGGCRVRIFAWKAL